MSMSCARKCWVCTDAQLKVTITCGDHRRLRCLGVCGGLYYTYRHEPQPDATGFRAAMNAAKQAARASTPRTPKAGGVVVQSPKPHVVPSGKLLPTGHYVEETAPGVRTYRMKL